MTTRVTVILPNYNHAAVIGRAVDCFRRQTRPADELIVVDDASTDDSVARIETAIEGIPGARLLRNGVNRGVAETLNRGIAEAGGDWVLLGAADDDYDPRMLEWLTAPLAEDNQVGLVCGNPVQRDEHGGACQRVPLPFGEVQRRLTPESLVNVARRRNFLFSTGACLISRRALQEVGSLDPALRWHCDWLANFVVAFRYGAWFVPRDVMRITAGQATFSAGRDDPEAQRQVIAAVTRKLVDDYSDVVPAFRRAALLPTYAWSTTATLIESPGTRQLRTPLLLWRLLSYHMLQRLGRRIPAHPRRLLRLLFRV